MSWVCLEQLLFLSRESLHIPWHVRHNIARTKQAHGTSRHRPEVSRAKFRFHDGISHIALQNLTLEARIGVSAAEQLSAHWKAETFSKILTSTAQRHLCNRPYSFKLTS